MKNIKLDKKTSDESPRNYWHQSITRLQTVFRTRDYSLLKGKIESLEEKVNSTAIATSKSMFTRNIQCLKKMQKLRFEKLIPHKTLKFKTITKQSKTIEILKLPIEVSPQFVFTLKENSEEKTAGLWFVAKAENYSKTKLKLFAEALYLFLLENHPNTAKSLEYSHIIDITATHIVNTTS